MNVNWAAKTNTEATLVSLSTQPTPETDPLMFYMGRQEIWHVEEPIKREVLMPTLKTSKKAGYLKKAKEFFARRKGQGAKVEGAKNGLMTRVAQVFKRDKKEEPQGTEATVQEERGNIKKVIKSAWAALSFASCRGRRL